MTRNQLVTVSSGPLGNKELNGGKGKRGAGTGAGGKGGTEGKVPGRKISSHTDQQHVLGRVAGTREHPLPDFHKLTT